MKTRWYFSALIILALFGALSQQQNTVPNQEIVLQFVDANISSPQAQKTIANVKAQLQTLGVHNIQVVENIDAGTLKITYYSDADVTHVKSILSNDEKLELGFATTNQHEDPIRFPSEKEAATYNFDVYKIADTNDSNSGFGGKYAIQLNQEFDRFFNPTIYPLGNLIKTSIESNNVKVAYTVNNEIAVAINNIPHQIPEGRAGPSA
ncbi:hypothetical protein ACFS5M_05910 [Lacinutrix iliipiscaria]|uniref:Uncharacterized protein n=1 Tax=Lacinutrix iliipiscaria TaxID=1230532 RepID=A0ABW5WPQ0_9FLAO